MKNTHQIDFITKRNMMLFVLGLVTIAVAFIFMAQPPVDGFLSRTLAPILLIVAYLIIIPIAIMARDKKKTTNTTE